MKTPKLLCLLVFATLTPLLARSQTTESFTFTTNRLVPDGDFSGLSDVENVSSAIGNISSLSVRLKMTGEFNGDVYAYLRHTNGFVVLLNRVGKTAANINGYSDSGFNVTFQTGAANGNIHLYQNVTTPTAGSPLTGVWQPDGRNADPTNVTDSSAVTTSLTNFNGFSGAGGWTLYIADVVSGGTNMLTQWGLDITGAAMPTITWTNPASITYGTALSSTQLNATATYNSTNVPGTFTYSVPAGTVLHAGNGQIISVTFTPTNTNSFMAVTQSVTINVLQAGLTITANSASKVYGSPLPSLTASYSGFVNGDSASSLSVLPSLATTATSGSTVGTYTITPSGAVDPDYAISYVNGTLTITQAGSSGTIASSQNPALPGANVTFTVTLGAVAPGAGTPTGNVNFRVDGTVTAISALSGGVATLVTNHLPVGSHTVVAEYAGDANFIGATNTLAPAQIINTPPVATNVFITRNPLAGTKVRLTTLLASASDADGDTLQITVSPTSSNGIAVSVQGLWVFYNPPAGFTNTDSFTYTVTDGRGGSATATVFVGIQNSTAPGVNLFTSTNTDGSILISGSGIPGYTYRLQFSTSAAPFNWQNVGVSLTADALGNFQYTDTTSQAQMRFYRTVYP